MHADLSFLLIKHSLEQPPAPSQEYVLLISSIILTVIFCYFFAFIIIVATPEDHTLSNERPDPTGCPGSLQGIFSEGK